MLRGSSFIAGNTATDGGGIHSSGGTVIMFDNARLRGNTAYADGGGIYVGESLAMTGSSAIVGNRAATGGGVWAWSADDLRGATCGTNVVSNAPEDCLIEFDY